MRVGVWAKLRNGSVVHVDIDVRGKDLERYRADPAAWCREQRRNLGHVETLRGRLGEVKELELVDPPEGAQ